MRYRIQRLFSTLVRTAGEHYRIEDEYGVRRFRVDNKLFAFRPTLTMRDASGTSMLSIERHTMRPDALCRIFNGNSGHDIATLQQQWVGSHMQFSAHLPGEADIAILGDWHEQAFDFKHGD